MKDSGFDLYPKPPGFATGYTSRNLNTSEYSSAQGPAPDQRSNPPDKGQPGRCGIFDGGRSDSLWHGPIAASVAEPGRDG